MPGWAIIVAWGGLCCPYCFRHALFGELCQGLDAATDVFGGVKGTEAEACGAGGAGAAVGGRHMSFQGAVRPWRAVEAGAGQDAKGPFEGEGKVNGVPAGDAYAEYRYAVAGILRAKEGQGFNLAGLSAKLGA